VFCAAASYLKLLTQRAKMEGFVVFDFASRYGEAMPKLMTWVTSGQIKYKEHIVDGLENAADALLLLFSGGNQGKLMVKVGERSPVSKL
jgi:NADPH-dependent curcumin reductase